MENKIIPVIMTIKDGFTLEEMPDFIKACEIFVENVKEEYKDKEVRIYFLPEELTQMLMDNQPKGDQ